MKKFFSEFKEFAVKGNVMSLAIGVIIGAAFQSVVTSLTDNIISPIIGVFTRQNFDSLQVTFLGVTLTYGAFITSLVNFIILAFIVFLIVKAMNRLTAPREQAAPATPLTRTCPYCMREIHIDAKRCPECTSELDDFLR